MKEQNDNIELIIFRSLRDSASTQEKELLDLWINESKDNYIKYQEYKLIWNTLNPPFEPENIDVEKAHGKVCREIRKTSLYKVNKLKHYWQQIASVIAIPLLILSGYYILYNTQENQTFDVIQKIKSPHGVTSQVNLPDGSKVWLNGGSVLSYSVNSILKDRLVELNGEAYFEVQSDLENPFTVKTERVRICATGTAFNVEAYTQDSITAITMSNGHVNVFWGKSSEIRMIAGDRVEFNNHTSLYELKQADPYKWNAWKEGILIFRDDPLSYVFKRLGIMFNVKIEIKDQSIAQLPYRATFEGESLSEILHLLEMTAPIQFHYAHRQQNSSYQFSKPHIQVVKR